MKILFLQMKFIFFTNENTFFLSKIFFSFTNENTFFKNEILYLANENTFFTNEKSNRYILFLFENSFHLNVDQR